MPSDVDGAFVSIGSTPRIEKIGGQAIAFSPVAPILAELGVVYDEAKNSYSRDRQREQFVYITNYETEEVIGKIPIACGPHTLSFSPDGKLLLAMPGGKGSPWDDILIYSEPWGSPPLVHNETLGSLFHGTWIDEWTILVAGTIRYEELCIALLNVASKTLRILYHEGRQPEPSLDDPHQMKAFGEGHLDSAFCSPSGLVAFSIGYGRRIATYQLTEDHSNVLRESSFPAKYNGYGLNIAIAENGQTILCTPSSYERPWVGLFDRQGKLLDTLALATTTNVYRHGIFLARRLVSRGICDLQIYRIKDGAFRLWCSSSGTCKAEGLDVTMRDGSILVAVEEEDNTKVSELQDWDILQLSSEDPDHRSEAARSLGDRRFKPAVPALTRLLWDESSTAQMAALNALEQISDPAALRQIIRALGKRPSDQLRGALKSVATQLGGRLLFFSAAQDSFDSELLSVIARFPIAAVTTAVFDCISRPEIAYRRGALRVLENIPSIESLEILCQVLSDVDEVLRQSAARALGARKDIRACVALLSHLNDDSLEIRLEVQHALITILEAGGLLSSELKGQLSEPMDVVSYADQVISKGRIQDFESLGDRGVGKFLSSLASACVNSNRPLPEILNSIEALTLPSEHFSERVSVSIALTIALICAYAMRRNEKWRQTTAIYRNVVTLSKRAEAPQIEWRAWNAVGECWELLGDDNHAFAGYREALDVIDRVWFSLLEEDKLRGFFRDKALLYDQAGLCALRLGHEALALEFNEKAKTRYLGDLIARKQIDPPTILDAGLKEFWQVIDGARPMRVPLASIQTPASEPMEIVSVRQGTIEAGSVVVMPERLIALEKASRSSENLVYWLRMVQGIWQLINSVATNADNPSANNESIRQCLEAIYESLLLIWDAVRSSSLPLSRAERELTIKQYSEAAGALRDNWRIWAFAEYGVQWIEEIANSTDAEDKAVVLDAVMEALNMLLRHRPVFGVPAASVEEEREGLTFVTRTLGRRPDSASKGTSIINTALERHLQTRWRYVTRLARGETINFQGIAKTLEGQPQVAQLQFTVTDHGTAVYITHNLIDRRRQAAKMPHLKGRDGLQVFTFPEITLSSLNKRLTQGEDSWFVRYQSRHQANGLQAWQEAMDRTLQWLYSQLMLPLDKHLKGVGVKHLRIIPHRGLHLIPFSALYSENHAGQRHYLVEDYDIEYAPSATIQEICRERAQRHTSNRTLTAISNPTNDLPFACAEVEQIARYFSDADVHILRSDAARLEKLPRSVPGSIFHFAGHGRYDWNDPLASHLRFAGKDQFTLADLFAENLTLSETRLVVLSACETNITNPEDLGDEYLGLASGFLFAGTPSVVSSLWAVNDISSSLLIMHFYQKHLHEESHPTQALRLAQNWLREDVDRPYVIQHIQSILKMLEKQRSEVLRWSEMEDSINKQILRLNGRVRELLDEERRDPGRRPFEHPYYWAAFTVCGAELDRQPIETQTMQMEDNHHE